MNPYPGVVIVKRWSILLRLRTITRPRDGRRRAKIFWLCGGALTVPANAGNGGVPAVGGEQRRGAAQHLEPV